MAFTITTNGTVTTYQGTDGVDQAAITSLPTGSTSVDVYGEGADDVVNWGLALSNSSIRGGAGNDILTPNIIAGATLISSFLNGNGGNDTIGNAQLGIPATLSTISGGQGNDTIYVGNLQSSIVNGNLGDDVINTGVASGATVNTSDSSIFGGQGNDTINVADGSATATGYVNTLIDGNLGNDTINVRLVSATTIFQNSIVAGGEGDDRIDASTSVVGVRLRGDAGADTLIGGSANDNIEGNDGEDSLRGNAGRDSLNGGAGGDFINGGAGNDVLTGGTGSNQFQQGANSTRSLELFNPNLLAGTLANPQVTVTGGVATASFAGANGSVQDVGYDGVINGGDTVTLNSGFDVITDWSAGAGSNKLATGAAGLVLGDFNQQNQLSWGFDLITPGFPNLPSFYTNGQQLNFAVRGTWRVNANGTESFEVAATPTGGEDILVATATIDLNAYAATATNPGSPLQNLVNSINSVTNWTVLDNVGSEFISNGTFV
ncbi:hypothetical protein KBZ20_13750 [Vulcanococcus limneticus Candia 3F8]|uniref:calcium-binding protein n=1 Tax=Vulcanococcus limneticus TaxID=2170428 RepID=UPI000D527851|nr:calcium-binding protein [Vulcanococcus limneticus]MCP9792838.1 hypothetical protein [Vulcanococcus limneticus MW73D5]MCP9894834.1 hypothetical protein [Vulcanococcus limneticus Candia 3F8]MCP9898313.1 hypothetical protein [Vulcanococcus limneticus Candia 3B3]